MMMDPNQITLQSYECHAQEYIDGTPHDVWGNHQIFIDNALLGLPSNASILEVGSAFGRDAAYIIERGYTLECTDASQSFVDYLNEHGFEAHNHNILSRLQNSSNIGVGCY